MGINEELLSFNILIEEKINVAVWSLIILSQKITTEKKFHLPY